ncbi:uncharacterized protein LOC135476795 [Liolophura sinensis]|uniref:uncharacterized protein LOC135476795 n=1 Tax=Liolophura sinensis TaxID=3198878 RepID=UPI0031586DC5
MAATLFNGSGSRYPYWTNVPPNVPKYPSSQEMFKRYAPEKFTQREGRQSYQHWTDKWYDSGLPVIRRSELPRYVDRREPCSQDWQYNPGTSAEPKWSRENKDWPVSSRFYTSGTPPAETMRARGLNRISQVEPNLYARSNYMTSTYRKPVYSIFGPLQREKVYGLTHQHNRHGFMPFEDYY